MEKGYQNYSKHGAGALEKHISSCSEGTKPGAIDRITSGFEGKYLLLAQHQQGEAVGLHRRTRARLLGRGCRWRIEFRRDRIHRGRLGVGRHGAGAVLGGWVRHPRACVVLLSET